MRLKMTLVGLLAGLLWISPSTVFSQDMKLGVLTIRGAAQAIKEWKATADYLTAKTGKTFTVVPLAYDQVATWVKEKKVDFFYTGASMYAEMNKLYGAQAIVTMVNQYNNLPLDRYGAVFLVKNNSPIEKLTDLKGKDVACASKDGFAGWLMASRLFLENGIDPEKDFKSVREVKTYDNTIFAVSNGAAAVALVRSGVLEKMAQEGKVKISDFKVLHQITDDFPLPHSTKLYPESPISACQHVPADLRSQVAKALIAIQPTDAAAIDFKIHGWKEPLDYKPVVECLTVIKYGAFKDGVPPAPAPPAPAAATTEEKQSVTSMAQPAPEPPSARTPAKAAKGRTSVP